MIPSIAGLIVCAAIYLGALRSASPLLVGLIVSLAFGATAIVNLPALGGSSPLIYVVFVTALLTSIVLRRDSFRELGTVFAQQPAAWLLVLLAVYAAAGSFLLPRIFAGQATIFIPQRIDGQGGGIVEAVLTPVTGNVTQTAYFLLGIMTFFGVSVLLLQRKMFLAVKQGFFACATVHVLIGGIDLGGKLAGVPDILVPLRSASYAMVTGVDIVGIWRIAGAYSEASAFGGATVALLAFTFSYWKLARSTCALALTIALSALLVLSTSSTAYVAGAVLVAIALASVAAAAVRNHLRSQDIALLAGALVLISGALAVILYDARVLEPVERLFDAMIVNKASSASGMERAYWNWRSLESVLDTAGLGVGLGSSRASSWLISVISQLGVAGTIMIALLVIEIARSDRYHRSGDLGDDIRPIALSARSSCLAGLLTASIAGSAADPGISFFVAGAVVLSYQRLSVRGSVPSARAYPRSLRAVSA
jgi:hypothetical protein